MDIFNERMKIKYNNAFKFHNYLLINYYYYFQKITYETNSFNLQVLNKHNNIISISFLSDSGIETAILKDDKIVDDNVTYHNYDFQEVTNYLLNYI